MTHSASMQPATLWKAPFTERTGRGLFTAPWLELPSEEGIAAVHHLSETLMRAPGRPDDLSITLGHLLAVHGHCQQAARAREPRVCQQHYGDALRECEIALSRLHHSKGGTPAALASWALGVHTLIRAQITMVNDPNSARLLAYESLHQLSGIVDPLCAGAEADALSAMLMVREPAELEARLAGLPDEVRALANEAEGQIDQKEAELNRALIAVHRNHEQALAWAVGWGLLNLALMATAPLNALYGTTVPWSLPFLVAVPALWYLTWGRPFKEGLFFWAYVRMLRLSSIADFKAVAADLPRPRPRFRERVGALLEHAERDHARLSAFYLYRLPDECDTCWKARAIADGVRERLHGDWMAELIDRNPWPLEEVLVTEPSMIPGITRVFYGISAH
ncbi:MAG: hypothetical protein ACOY94_26905 [Bacillota bacterium]